MSNTLKVILNDAYGKMRTFQIFPTIPKHGDIWINRGSENARVQEVTEINAEIAETTSGDPKAYYDFYKVDIVESDPFDGFSTVVHEYIAVAGGYMKHIGKDSEE